MRDVDTATDLARELDTALGSTLQVLRMIQYGGQASSDELRRIVDMGERVRNRAAWISDGKIGSQLGLAPSPEYQSSVSEFGMGASSTPQGRRP